MILDRPIKSEALLRRIVRAYTREYLIDTAIFGGFFLYLLFYPVAFVGFRYLLIAVCAAMLFIVQWRFVLILSLHHRLRQSGYPTRFSTAVEMYYRGWHTRQLLPSLDIQQLPEQEDPFLRFLQGLGRGADPATSPRRSRKPKPP